MDYDEENDSLFAYSSEKKSAGAVETGNFIFDLDSSENLVGMEFLDVSELFKVIFSKVIEVSKIKEFRANIINFRNTTSVINFSITTDEGIQRDKLIIPKVGNSPVF
ncbi:DUF2283 domain-containing protein [Candidatus Pacearchaeota archaeon]|nr:DUF2283 domain-containing protein [Candidatus Pacearchaeota archaeon]